MRMQAKYMFIFGAFWILWAGMNILTYVVQEATIRNGWNAAISFLLSGKGMFDLIAWFWVSENSSRSHACSYFPSALPPFRPSELVNHNR